MPVRILGSGAMVLVDDEDWDFSLERSWHVYEIRPSRKQAAAVSEVRHGRMHRLYLHREIALRMKPELIKRKFRVYPKNGSYLDCRRENLDVVVQKKGDGRPKVEPRPLGWKRYDVKKPNTDPTRPTSPAWAGGYVWLQKDRRHKGGRTQLTKCIGTRAVD